jgi:hypothetical protein
MYTLPLLSKKLADIAESFLPKFSGQEKILQVLIKFNYLIDKNEKLPFGVTNSEYQHIKVVFWYPNNAMLVGYNFETMVENIFDNFIISSNYSSTWKSDGLNFFHEILHEPNDWEILEVKLIDVELGSAVCQLKYGTVVENATSEDEEFVFRIKEGREVVLN